MPAGWDWSSRQRHVRPRSHCSQTHENLPPLETAACWTVFLRWRQASTVGAQGCTGQARTALAKAKPEAMLHQDLLARDIIGTINRCVVQSGHSLFTPSACSRPGLCRTHLLCALLHPQPAVCGIDHETQPGRCSRRDKLAAKRSNKKGARLNAPLLAKQLLW